MPVARFYRFNSDGSTTKIGKTQVPVNDPRQWLELIPAEAEALCLEDDPAIYHVGGQIYSARRVRTLFSDTSLPKRMRDAGATSVHITRDGRFIFLKVNASARHLPLDANRCLKADRQEAANVISAWPD